MKPQGCIWTGCMVEFVDYGQLISADVYRVGETLVVRTLPDQIGGSGGRNSLDRKELQVQSIEPTFWRTDIGVFVVMEKNCRWLTTPR